MGASGSSWETGRSLAVTVSGVAASSVLAICGAASVVSEEAVTPSISIATLETGLRTDAVMAARTAIKPVGVNRK
jgi:hypothetical protein